MGAERTVVHAEAAVPADDHPTPPDAHSAGCGWPEALAVAVDPEWRSGYYEVVLEIDVDGKPRRSHAFFVVRPRTGQPTAPVLLALATNTWHAYNDFGGRNLYTGGTHVSLQRPMSPGYLHKPPGLGRRVTTTAPPDPQMAAHVGYLSLNHLSPYAGSAGWPDWEQPFLAWAEREGYAVDVVTNADLEDHPDLLSGDELRAVPLGGPRRVLVGRHARHGRGLHRSGRQRRLPLGQHRLLAGPPGGPPTRGAGRHDGGLQGSASRRTRSSAPTASRAHEHVVRPPHRAAREPHDRRELRPGRLPPNRQAGDSRGRRLHDPPGRPLALRRHRPRLRRRARRGCHHRRLRVRRLRLHLPRRPPPPHRLGWHACSTSPSWAPPLPPTSPAPPPPDPPHRTSPPRSSSSPPASSAAAAPRRTPSASPTATPCSARTRHRRAGSSSRAARTDWAHGLVGRDPQVEQITRNILDRLG